jgi:cytochrome b
MQDEKFENRSSKKRNYNKKFSIRVWDIPTRLFHWLLVGLIIFSFTTGKIGISAMQYHEWSGFAILVLIAFRLVWGFAGGKQSRFGTFVKGPSTAIRYASSMLSKDSEKHIGHNPLGGWSIIAMLAALLVQAGTGLFANDDILTEGPLYDLVSKDTSDWLTSVHHINQQVLIVLVAIHICAILFHLVAKRENLITPMITGKKVWNEKLDSSWGSPALALFLAAVIAAILYVFIY